MAVETVVIDEGSAQSKATFSRDGKVVTVTIASRVEAEAKVSMEGYSPSSYFTDEGDHYTVNPDLDETVDTFIPSYQTSTANRAILHETLRVAGFSGKDVRVCVTLPVGRYFGDGPAPKDEELIEKKRKNTMAGITAANKEPVTKIVECRVYPEAVPALFELTRNNDGSMKKGYSESDKSLVIDIGGATTDLSIVTPAGDIQSYASISNCGVLDIAAALSKRLKEKYSLKSDLSASLLDEILKQGQFAGEPVKDDIAKSSRRVMKTIITRLEKMIPNIELLDNVFVVGGGALLMGKQLTDELEIDNAVIPENADEVISRGIYKLEMLTHGGSEDDNQ